MLQSVKDGFSTFWGRLASASNHIARLAVINKMRSRHSGYLCAPHQFLESKLLKQVRRIPPSKSLTKHVVYSFHLTDIHPLEVVKHLNDGDYYEWRKERAKPCHTSVDDPLHLQPISANDPERLGSPTDDDDDEDD